MKCPMCGDELRTSEREPNYGLCDNCHKKFRYAEDFDEEDYEDCSDIIPSIQLPSLYLKYKKIELNTQNNTLSVSQKGVAMEDSMDKFVLLWSCEKPLFKKTQIEVVFTHKAFKSPIQLLLVNSQDGYELLSEFKKLCDSHMVKQLQKSAFASYGYQLPKTQEEIHEALKQTCPRCGCDHIQISVSAVGEYSSGRGEVREKSALTRAGNKAGRTGMVIATGGLWALTPKRSTHKKKTRTSTNIINRKVAVCQDCGNSWYVR